MKKMLSNIFSKKLFFIIPALYLLGKIYVEYSGVTILSQDIFYGMWLWGALFVFAVVDFGLTSKLKDSSSSGFDWYDLAVYVFMYFALALQFSIGVSLLHWLFVLLMFVAWRVMILLGIYEQHRDYIVQYCVVTGVLLTTSYFRWNVFIPLIFLLLFFIYMIGRYSSDNRMRLGESILYIAIGLLLYCEVLVLSLVVPISSYSVAIVLSLATYAYIQSKEYFIYSNA